ncbi:MAG: TetR family transcriptional regulator [Myxococcales bacterium]|nr:TetR family transcriptional regulator [Myxococcales bacterium]
MRPARRDGIQRYDALLDTALACFSARGLLHTGIEDVRRAAGASPSSVYNLFDGLPDLMGALLERIFERLFAHLVARVTRARSARLAVLALVDGHLSWILRHRDEGRFMYQAMSLGLEAAAMEALQARKAELLTPLVAHFARFVERGELPRWPALALDVVLLGPSHEALRRFLGGAALDPRWMRAQLPRLAWQTVAPPPRLPARATRGRASRGRASR